MTVGDLYWVEFLARGGHAQSGCRPARVMQNEAASARLPTVLLVPLTTQTDALRFPGTVLVQPDTENGLRRPSVALAFQRAAVDKAFLAGRLGHLHPDTAQAVQNTLRELMGN